MTQHQDERETKATFRISNSLYQDVITQLDHGQPSLLFRKLFLGVKKILDEDQKDDLMKFLYSNYPLVIESIKEE